MARAWVAEHHEAETVARLIAGFRDSYGRDTPTDDVILAGVERLIETTDMEFLLAAADDDSPPTGVMQLRFRFCLWTAAPDCWLEDLFVDPSARRRGVADALMTLAFYRARDRGARRMELDTWQTNAGAIALYRRHGFSEQSKANGCDDLLFGAPVQQIPA